MTSLPDKLHLIKPLCESLWPDVATLQRAIDALPQAVIVQPKDGQSILLNRYARETMGLSCKNDGKASFSFHTLAEPERSVAWPLEQALVERPAFSGPDHLLVRSSELQEIDIVSAALTDQSGNVVGTLALLTRAGELSDTGRNRRRMVRALRNKRERDLRTTEHELRSLNETLERRVLERTSDAQHRADQLLDLAFALADAEARERKRLAQRLHDGLQQFLSAARLKAALVRRRLSGDDVSAVLQVERMLEQAIDESRALTADLSPPVLYDAGLCPAVEAMARNFEQKRGIRTKLCLDPAAEPKAEQVRVLLFEAIRELLTNIVSHAKATQAGISITLSPERQIQIEVTDNGIGFDPKTLASARSQDKLFGLMEIRERLTYLRGGMVLESSPNRGSTVRLFVPAELREEPHRHLPAVPTKSAIKQSTTETVPAKAGTYLKRPCRIVVADDHAIFREGLINLISQDPDFQVVGEAEDGQQAVEVSSQLKPDILVVDLTMPKLNGIEVTAKLSRQLPGLKIVGLSMHEQDDMASAMKAAGACAYLTKGGSSEALIAMLRELATEPLPRSDQSVC